VRDHRRRSATPDGLDARPHLLDDPGRLIAEHPTGLGAEPPVVHVQVRAARRARRDPKHHIRGLLDPRVLHVCDDNLTRTLVHAPVQPRLAASASGCCSLPENCGTMEAAPTPSGL
jgi:hypothetical protein